MKLVPRTRTALILLALSFLSLLVVGTAASTFSAAAIGLGPSISVGPNPAEMAFDTKDNSIFVVVGGSGSGTASVTDINGATNAIINTQKVTQPVDIAYNPTNNEIYVTSKNTGVSAINGATGKLVKKVNVATNDFRQDLAYDPTNGNIYVVNTNPGTVSVISSSTNTVISTIKTGSYPQHIAYNPADGNMYVFVSTKSALAPFVSVISSSTNKVVKKIPLSSPPGSDPAANLAYDPASASMLVSNDMGSVFVISGGKVAATISATVLGMTFNPSNGEMYAVGGGLVYAISSTNSIVSTITTPGCYVNLAYDQVNNDIYVGGSIVNVISSSNSLVASVTTGAQGFVLFNPIGGDVIASLMASPGSVVVISSS